MGNGFLIELVGDNSLDLLSVWGAMYGGSVKFTGSGSLTLNKDLKAQYGLVLNCEASSSCIMVDKSATVEIYGNEAAFAVLDSLLEKTVYFGSKISMQGKNGEKLVVIK